MKEKIVLIKSEYGTITSVIDDGDFTYWLNNGYVIITKSVEVEFPDLPKETVVNNQIAVIDKKITDIMARSEATITQLKARKQELLAITHDTGE